MTVGPSDFTPEDMVVEVVDPADIDAEKIEVPDDDTD